MPRDWVARQVHKLPVGWRAFLHRWWPVISLAVFVWLGFTAFVVFGNLVDDVRDAQDEAKTQRMQIAAQQQTIQQNVGNIQISLTRSDRITCILARAVTKLPIEHRPGEPAKTLRARVNFAKLLVRLARGIDCAAALGPVLHPKGGDAQSPNQGSQLPGGHRAPPPADTATDIRRHEIPVQARIPAPAEGHPNRRRVPAIAISACVSRYCRRACSPDRIRPPVSGQFPS